MADEEIKVKATPINHVVIKGAIAFSAEHARIWAEGTDEEVEQLGGEHSAKGWSDSAIGEAKTYTDEQIALAKTELTGQINTAAQGAVQTANSYTDTQVSEESSQRQSADNLLQQDINQEAEDRTAADTNLQSQIDAIVASSDVFDIVGTYAELQAYDTSTVPVNDIIKVLVDETHGDSASYYRWTGTTWSYIGSEGASYTKAEADTKFLSKTEAASTYETKAQSAADIAAAVSTKASNADGSTIVDNGTTISTVAVKEQNDNKVIKKWVGTKAQYDAIATKDANTTYIVTDEDDSAMVVIDSSLSSTSTHAVQNRVIYNALQGKQATLPDGTTGYFLQKTATGVTWAQVQAGGGGAPTLTWYTGNTGTTVTISDTSSAALVKIYKNGILLEPTADYSISGTTLTLVTALVSTDKITVEVF